ncbi:MAG: FG-GAP-like repeat-containing protein, partial [Aurantibacter sp.]
MGQTSFTESAALYNLDIGGIKDGGHAWADYDKDGDLDLLVNRDSTNSVLLRNQFIESGTASFIDMTLALTDGMNTWRERSAIFADFTNDSYPDFARNTSYAGIEIRLQHPATHIFGDGLGGTAPYVFNDLNVSDGVNTEGMVAFDFDQDGDLDIAFDNHDYGIDLLINDGNGIFTHGTPKGVNYDINDSTTWPHGLAQDAIDGDYSSGTDYDNDGFVDIISRKNGQVDFFRNIGGQFASTSIDIDDSDNSSKGGIGFYDFDNDGDFDLLWTENGVNQIHENQNGVYVALGASTGIPTMFSGDKIEGMACGDIDNDGDIDVFMAGNDGYLFINQLNSAAGQNTGSPMTFIQDTSTTFLAGPGNGEGCTFVDFDRDGDLDLYTNVSNGPNHLYINDLSNANSDKYLFVDIIENRDLFNLTGTEQRYAVGATARLVDCDGNVISGIREVNGGNGHGTQDPQRIHFGIPFDADIEIIVEVFFPTAFGERQVVRMPFVPNTLGTGWERKAVITPDETTPNNAPIANDDTYDLNYEPDPVTLTPLVNDSDNEGDTLQILSISQPDRGTA